MAIPQTFLAASVPRYLRQTKLGYLPLNSVIGTRVMPNGAGGTSLIYDVIMLPEREFQRMRLNIGLQHVATPNLRMGGGFDAAFVPTDTKRVLVQPDDRNPLATARTYLVQEFTKDRFFTPTQPRQDRASPAEEEATDAHYWPVE